MRAIITIGFILGLLLGSAGVNLFGWTYSLEPNIYGYAVATE